MEANKKDPINWMSSFASHHKIPYGTYVLKNELQSLFPNKKIEEVNQTPYLFLKDSTRTGTYLFINKQVDVDKPSLEQLLQFIERGNKVFIASQAINLDTLSIESVRDFSFKDEIVYQLVNKNLDSKSVYFDHDFKRFYFSKVDTVQTKVLGVLKEKDSTIKADDLHPNFIETKVGKGTLFLHLDPYIFTNFFLLKDNTHPYASSVLSYIDSNTIYVDAHFKNGKSRIVSPMHYILNNKNLKWAYFTVLVLLVLYVIFKGKRTQRAIPIIKPLQNTTLGFTRTIASMYFTKSDHTSIFNQQVMLFLDYIRVHLNLSTQTLDNDLYEKVAARSNNTLEDVINLFQHIKKSQESSNVSKEDLQKLYKLIEQFKAHYEA